MTKHILLVEDSRTDEKLTLRAFQKAGIANEILVVRDGAEALEYVFCTGRHAARDAADGPALVLLDLSLPRVDGLEVLKRIRSDARTKLLPVVVLTSSKQDEDIVRSYAMGANAYVRKPLSFGEFADAAKALGMFWLMLNELPPHQKVSAKP
jgi:two-component system, response regulator